METKDWLLFVGPILGIIAGFGPAYFLRRLDNVYQREKDDRDFLRDRLEKLHHLSIGLVTMSGEYCQRLIVIRLPDKTLPERAAELAKLQKDITAAVADLTSNQRLYAPEAAGIMKKILRAAQTLTAHSSDFLLGNITDDRMTAIAGEIGFECYELGTVIQARMHDSLRLGE